MNDPEQNSEPGEVITFYSYKGGTGRSMALANVACLLTRKLAGGKGVLMVDWDLEAPGLHRFFHDRLTRRLGQSESVESALDKQPGLIDLFDRLNDAVNGFEPEIEEPTDEMLVALRQKVRLEDFVLETDVPSLHLMTAGRFDTEYPKRINAFPWEVLYNKAPWLFPLFADWLTAKYRYVLIDSRTGVTDTSGICTMLMPEKLVAVFTPNRQSILGVLRLLKRATNYRRSSPDLRPLMIYPLPSRIDQEDDVRRTLWRLGDSEQDIPAYQPHFEKLFERIYGLPQCNLQNYFGEVGIQHSTPYSYGEEVATLVESTEDRFSLSHSYEVFTQRLIETAAPWEEIDESESQAEVTKLIALAEKVYANLSPPEQEQARRLFTRLVRLARPEEGGEDTCRRLNLADQKPLARSVIKKFTDAGVVLIEQDQTKGVETARAVNESFIRNWGRLRNWIDGERDFLFWRQKLQVSIAEWERHERDPNALLLGVSLKEAENWLGERINDLNDIEQLFIEESIRRLEVKRSERRRKIALPLALSMLIFLLLFAYLLVFHREKTLITLRIWPGQGPIPWVDEFIIDTNEKGGKNAPNANLWDYPEGHWVIVKGEGDSPDDGALLVSGSSWGVLNNLGAKAYYDFTTEFKVGFRRHTKAAWVFRAQPDKRRGYVFELEDRGGSLLLNGWVYLGDKQAPLKRGSDDPLLIMEPFDGNDAFSIVATVKGFEFKYCVTLVSGVDPSFKDARQSVGHEYCTTFTDEGRNFRYGNMGLLEKDAESQMRVEFWRVTVIR